MPLPPEVNSKTAVILGSGPSLDGFDYKALSGRFVIAVNDAALLQYRASPVLLSTDARWCASLASGERSLEQWGGELFVSTEIEILQGFPDPRLRMYRRCRAYGLNDDPDFLNGIYTSVQAALNFAAHCGVARIVLLGIDLQAAGGRKYTYGGETTERTARQFATMKAALESCAAPLAEKGIDVINGSPESALQCWPRNTPIGALRAADGGVLEMGS